MFYRFNYILLFYLLETCPPMVVNSTKNPLFQYTWYVLRIGEVGYLPCPAEQNNVTIKCVLDEISGNGKLVGFDDSLCSYNSSTDF